MARMRAELSKAKIPSTSGISQKPDPKVVAVLELNTHLLRSVIPCPLFVQWIDSSQGIHGVPSSKYISNRPEMSTVCILTTHQDSD